MAYSKYIVIPAEVFLSTKINDRQKILYGHISAMCNFKGYCWATNSYISELMKCSEQTVSKDVSVLNEIGFVTSMVHKTTGGTNRAISIPKMSFSPEKNETIDPEELEGGSPARHTGMSSQTSATILFNNKDNIPLTPKREFDQSAQEQYNQYIKLFNIERGTNCRGDVSSLRNFKARLKDGWTVENMITALKNAMKDDFHIGNGYKYLTPSFFTRGDKIDKFLMSETKSPLSGELNGFDEMFPQ